MKIMLSFFLFLIIFLFKKNKSKKSGKNFLKNITFLIFRGFFLNFYLK